MEQPFQRMLDEDTDKRPVVGKKSIDVAPSSASAEKQAGRQPRADRGRIIPTRRDLACLTWIADQYAVRGDHIRLLLSRFPDVQKPFRDQASGLIAETTTRDLIARWRRAGWIEYQLVLNDQPGWAWATKRGLVLVGLDERYTYRVPASTRLDHYYGINEIRLSAEGSGHTWQSERWYRSEQPKTKKGQSSGPIPDGVVMTVKGSREAIEVELSAKKPEDLLGKLQRLVYYQVLDQVTFQRVPGFRRIRFFVATERMKEVVERAVKHLQEDEQKRVLIDVRPSLVALRHQPGAEKKG